MDIISVLEATWASHEAFRKLGFPAESIYVVTGKMTPDVFVQVRQGKAEFNFTVGPRGDFSPEQFGEKWQRFAARINEGEVPQAELERIYKAWVARCDVPGLMVALGRKGLSIPIARVL